MFMHHYRLTFNVNQCFQCYIIMNVEGTMILLPRKATSNPPRFAVVKIVEQDLYVVVASPNTTMQILGAFNLRLVEGILSVNDYLMRVWLKKERRMTCRLERSSCALRHQQAARRSH